MFFLLLPVMFLRCLAEDSVAEISVNWFAHRKIWDHGLAQIQVAFLLPKFTVHLWKSTYVLSLCFVILAHNYSYWTVYFLAPTVIDFLD